MRGGSWGAHLDRASRIVIVLTFVLFAAALIVKGLEHDLFLEAGVLLVSVKLILNGLQVHTHLQRVEAQLDELRDLLRQPPPVPRPRSSTVPDVDPAGPR
jgi:hypothetical protein